MKRAKKTKDRYLIGWSTKQNPDTCFCDVYGKEDPYEMRPICVEPFANIKKAKTALRTLTKTGRTKRTIFKLVPVESID